MTKLAPKLKNDQNIPKNLKITKIPLKPKKWLKYLLNLYNGRNNPVTYKMTEIPPKPKNDQNTPKPKKWSKHPET